MSGFDLDLERVRSIADRVFRPARPLLARCLAQVTTAPQAMIERELEVDPKDPFAAALALVVRPDEGWNGPTSGREAWETVAPMEWLSDDRRRFERSGEAPLTVRNAVALASDPEGVIAAENLARSFADRCHGLLRTGVSTQSVGWQFVDARRYRSRFCARAKARSGDQIFAAACDRVNQESADRARTSALTPAVTEAIDAVRARVLSKVGPVAWDASALLGWHLRLIAHEIPSPFEPLVALWELGYALDELTDERTVLVAANV